MKLKKEELTETINFIIAESVGNVEPYDVTTGKVVSALWPFIDYLQVQNELLKKRLKK